MKLDTPIIDIVEAKSLRFYGHICRMLTKMMTWVPHEEEFGKMVSTMWWHREIYRIKDGESENADDWDARNDYFFVHIFNESCIYINIYIYVISLSVVQKIVVAFVRMSSLFILLCLK